MIGTALRVAALLLLAHAATAGEDFPFGLVDLEAYRAALASKSDASAPMVRFRELWDHPEAHAGRAVAVEGRVARIFRQPAQGEFPALVEAWVVSPDGDPICLVFPGGTAPEVGASVRFSGTFLRRVEYRGGDVARIAPLVVGPKAPTIAEGAGGMSWSSNDWTMALGACLVVAFILARRHLARPAPPPRSIEPPPAFVDGEPDEAGGDSF